MQKFSSNLTKAHPFQKPASGAAPTPTPTSTRAPDASDSKGFKRRNCTHKRTHVQSPLPNELQRPPRRQRQANTSSQTGPSAQGDLLEQIANAKTRKALDHALALPEGQRLSALSELKHAPEAELLKDIACAKTGADLDKVQQKYQSHTLGPVGPETTRFDAAPLRQRMNKR